MSVNMFTYTFGGKNGTKHVLHESTDMVAVRTRNSRNLKKCSNFGKR